MNRTLLIFLLLLKTLTSYSQIFGGVVRNESGEPLEGVTVVATSEGNKTLAFCITDEKGKYQLNIDEEKKIVSITFSFMGFQKNTVSFAAFRKEMDIILIEASYSIKEVIVKSQRLKSSGDTLTYSVAGFKQSQDHSIADVIAKMPGLEVKANGKIEYQGVPINKFYIEGLDLMGPQYGIANKNLSASKVQCVQVLENHQSIKSLIGVSFSEQAALNIVLKDDAKATWTGTADIGLGYGEKELFDNRLMGMCFDRKIQTVTMYKGNSNGHHLDNEVLDLTDNQRGRNGIESGILSLISLGVPDLSEDRYTFNKSHLIAVNWLWKIGKDSELRLQGNGFIDKTDMQSYRSSNYLTLADLPVIIEEQDVTNTRSEWKGEANYQYNGNKTYLRNNVRGYMDFNKSVGSMLYNDRRTDMMVKPHKRSLTEDFQLSHTTSKGNVYKVNSYWAYNYQPGQMLTIGGLAEQLNLGFFTTQNDVAFKYKIGKHYLNNVVGIDYDHQNIDAALEDNAEQANAYELLRTYWTPSMSFLFGKHRLDVETKLSYAHQSYRLSKSNHLWLDPSLRWNWRPTVVSEFSANVRYSNTPLKGISIYDTPIFTNYRTIRTNRGKTEVQHTLLATVGYKYSNPVAGVFFNIRPMFNRTSGNMLYQSNLKDNVYSMTATDKEYDLQTFVLSGRISKTFSWAKTLIALGASHNVTDYSLLISEVVNDARMDNTDVGVDYSFRPLRLLSVEGKSNVNIYKQQNLTHPELSSGSTTDWQHFLNLHIFPVEKWMLSVKNELFHTDEEGVDANYFLDLVLSYKAKRWELSLMANNIIGTSEFERRILSNTVESYNITRLRPTEFFVKCSFDL